MLVLLWNFLESGLEVPSSNYQKAWNTKQNLFLLHHFHSEKLQQDTMEPVEATMEWAQINNPGKIRNQNSRDFDSPLTTLPGNPVSASMYWHKKWKYLNIYNKDGWEVPSGVNRWEVHKPSNMINFSWRQEYINTKWVICSTVGSKFLLLVPTIKKKCFQKETILVMRSHQVCNKWKTKRIIKYSARFQSIKSTINEKQLLTHKKV